MSDGVVRIDRYTIEVQGLPVRANANQELQLRRMSPAQQINFLKTMGLILEEPK